MLLCCAFPSMGCTATPQFHYSFFFPVLHSGHRISLLSYSNTFPPIAFFLPHFIYCTLVISSLFASSSLQFHTSWYRSHHMFLTCLLRRNPCSWFSWIWTPLPSYPPQSTYIATISFVNYSLSSRSAPSRGMFPSLQHFCAFSHVRYAGLLSCYAFCSLATCTASSLLLLSFSATMFGHFHL